MKSTIVLSNPPAWWHSHGRKINVSGSDFTSDGFVSLESSVTDLLIRPVTEQKDIWYVGWRILHGPEDESGGSRTLSTEELLGAFGLNNYVGDQPSLNEIYGTHSAKSGVYARTGRHLNIPCPGTGSDGDPNISIWVEEKIQEAVSQLVAAQNPTKS